MAEQNFTKGLIIKKPHEKAPEWVKAAISIKVDEFAAWLQENVKPDGWVNIDVCESREGDKWYGRINNWTKEKKEEPVIDMEGSSPF